MYYLLQQDCPLLLQETKGAPGTEGQAPPAATAHLPTQEASQAAGTEGQHAQD